MVKLIQTTDKRNFFNTFKISNSLEWVLKFQILPSALSRIAMTAYGQKIFLSFLPKELLFSHCAAEWIRFFSKEKMFILDAKVNWRINSWRVQDPEEDPIIGRIKYPASVYVLLFVYDKVDVMPLTRARPWTRRCTSCTDCYEALGGRGGLSKAVHLSTRPSSGTYVQPSSELDVRQPANVLVQGVLAS